MRRPLPLVSYSWLISPAVTKFSSCVSPRPRSCRVDVQPCSTCQYIVYCCCFNITYYCFNLQHAHAREMCCTESMQTAVDRLPLQGSVPGFQHPCMFLQASSESRTNMTAVGCKSFCILHVAAQLCLSGYNNLHGSLHIWRCRTTQQC